MKALILLFSFLFISATSYSQDSIHVCSNVNIFDSEWYDKLDSDLEFIVYYNDCTEEVNFRVYRGDSQEHYIEIYDYYGNLVYKGIHGREENLKLPQITHGLYLFKISNEKKVLSCALAVN